MPWHQSRSEPRKVYDERHQVACIAESPELAAFIIRSVNGAVVSGAALPIRLREPAAVYPAPVQQADMVDHDDCCGPRLLRALRQSLNGDSWVCPNCGCEWRAVVQPEASVRRWSPVTDIQILVPRHA